MEFLPEIIFQTLNQSQGQLQYVLEQKYKTNKSSELYFWIAFTYYKNNRINDAINKLESFNVKEDFRYLWNVGLAYFYQALEEGGDDMAFREMLSGGDESPWTIRVNAGFAMLLSNNADYFRATKLAEDLDEYNPSMETKCLLGFCNLFSAKDDREQLFKKAYEFLLAAQAMDARSMLTFTGLLNYYKYTNNRRKALDVCNQMVAADEDFLPALIERAQINLLKNLFDEAEETLIAVLEKDKNNVLAKYILLFKMILNPSPDDELEKQIEEFFKQIKKVEVQNTTQIISMVKTLSRTCGRDKHVLQGCRSLMEEAIKVNPQHSSELVVELGFIHFLSGDQEAACNVLQKAIKEDDSNVLAMYYTSLARVQQGSEDDLQQVEEQLEFFKEMDDEGNGGAMQVSWIKACLFKKREPLGSEWFECLSETLKLHIESLSEIKLDLDVSQQSVLNVDLMNELVNLSIRDLGLIPQERSNQLFAKCLNQSENILEKITEFIPCNKDAQLMLSLVHVHRQSQDKALKTLSNLEEYGQQPEASLLKSWAQCCINQLKEANSELNMVVSLDFKAKDSPLYALVEAVILEKEMKVDEAVGVLQKAFESITAKKKKKKNAVPEMDMRLKVTLEDRASIMLKLIEQLSVQKRFKEAMQIMSDSITEFKGTSQEIRLLIANAELSVSFGEIKQAINILKNIDKSSAIWVESQKRLANMYLTHIKDRRLYKLCFFNILEEDRSVNNLVLVGDALMEICEPDEAIVYYQEAQDSMRGKVDRQLIRKIGKALIQNHDYQHAVEQQEDAIKSQPDDAELRQDLAKLYLDIDQIQHANNVLEEALKIEAHTHNQDVLQFKRLVVIHLGLARSQLQRQDNNIKNASADAVIEHQQQSMSFQNKVLNEMKDDKPENIQDQKKFFAQIAYEQGHFLNVYLNRSKEAVEVQTQGIRTYPRLEKLIVEYADLQMREGNYKMVEKAVHNLLQIDPDNSEAHKLQAQVHCMNNDIQAAITLLTDSYRKKKDTALLEELLLTLRRQGQISEMHQIYQKFILPNNKNNNMAQTCALYFMYTHKAADALKHFNTARMTSRNKFKAIAQMMDIQLHPELDPIMPELPPSMDRDALARNLKDATGLLDELKLIDEDELTTMIYQALILISNRNGKDAQSGINILNELKENSKITSSKWLQTKLYQGLLAGNLLLRNTEEIVSIGKKVKAILHNSECVLDLTKAQTLMIRQLIDTRNNNAVAMCKQCLALDQSNIKILELFSELQENTDVTKSIQMLETAWNISDQAMPQIGFKLAKLLFENKDYMKCIDICNHIQFKQPDQPSIQEEIQKPSLMNMWI